MQHRSKATVYERQNKSPSSFILPVQPQEHIPPPPISTAFASFEKRERETPIAVGFFALIRLVAKKTRE